MDGLLATITGWYSAYSNLIDTVGINALLALSLYVMLNCGQLSLGSAAYMGVGAYTSALLSTARGWPFAPVLAAGVAMAMACALALGLPVLRLRGVYLAIATLAFVGVLQVVALNWTLTGEAEGLGNIPLETTTWMIYLALVVVCFLLWRVRGSALGRAFGAIREDEIAARAMGIDAARVKLLAFVLSGGIAGLAGALDAHLHFFINPPNYGFGTAVDILTYTVVGGLTSFGGSVAGAALITLLPEVLRFLHDVRAVFNGLIVLLVIVLLPQGLLGFLGSVRVRGWRGQPAVPEGVEQTAGLGDLSFGPSHVERRSGSGGQTLVVVEQVSRMFGGVRALDAVSLQVEEGDIVGLIGPNGAGKTTLLNMLSAFDQPTAGQVLIGGRALDGQRPHALARLGVARTFQNIRLFRALSVLDNVLAGQLLVAEPHALAHLLGLPRARGQTARVGETGLELLRVCGLASQAYRPAGTLSYGDQRRLEIARALGRRPRLLLLDEPAAGLNPREKDELQEMVRGLAAAGRTIVIVDHDMNLVMKLCRRIVVLNFGRVIAQGAPAAIAADPAVIEAYLGSDA